MATVAQTGISKSLGRERWTQLFAGVICMIMIANLQYGWTLFVNPIAQKHGWSIAAIQVAFTVFVALETWLTPLAGWIVDKIGPRNGPRLMVAFGGVTIGAGWVLNGYADSLWLLYLGSSLAGIGGGLYAHHFSYIEAQYFSVSLSISIVLYVLFGGTQSVLGPLVGAAVFTLLPELLRGSAQWRYVLFAAVVIVVMVWRPQGLVTGAQMRRLFGGKEQPA